MVERSPLEFLAAFAVAFVGGWVAKAIHDGLVKDAVEKAASKVAEILKKEGV